MFKLLTIGLVSLLGMEYSTKCQNNIKYYNATPVVVGGLNYDEMNGYSGFLKPVAPFTFYYDDNTAPTQAPLTYSFNYRIDFKCDYLFFRYVNSGNGLFYDSRINDTELSFNFYSLTMRLDYDGRSLFTLGLHTSVNEQIKTYRYYDYSYNSSLEENGLEIFYDNIYLYSFYVSNFQGVSLRFARFNPSSNSSISVLNVSHNIPIITDDRFVLLDRYFTFGDMLATYGYWYGNNEAYYYDGQLISPLSTYKWIPIFKGLFSSFNNYYYEYDFDMISVQQPNSGGWYFGNVGITSLSNAQRPSSGSIFSFTSTGAYRQVSDNLYRPIWHTVTTPVTSSGVTNYVISNVHEWYNSDYKSMYIYYQNSDLSTDTYINGRSYYEMLTFNVGYTSIGGGTTLDSLTNVFSILGIAFSSIWSLGQITLFGSLTLNTLILMPLIVSLIMFFIHLIKKGG